MAIKHGIITKTKVQLQTIEIGKKAIGIRYRIYFGSSIEPLNENFNRDGEVTNTYCLCKYSQVYCHEFYRLITIYHVQQILISTLFPELTNTQQYLD